MTPSVYRPSEQGPDEHGPGVLPKPALEPHALVHLTRSSRDVFQYCADLALQATRATTAMVILHDGGRNMLTVKAAAGHLAADAVGQSLGPGQALAWRAFDSGVPFFTAQAARCADARFISGIRRPGMYLGVPLSDPDGRVFGVLSVDTTDSDEVLGDEDVKALTLLGQATGVAYARLHALEQAQQSAQRFERLAHLFSEMELTEHPDTLARQALQALTELSGFSVGALFGVQPDGRVALQVLAGRPGPGDFDAQAWSTPHHARGIVEQVMRSGQTAVIEEYQSWPHQRPFLGSRVQTAVATPLHADGQISGVLGLAHFQARREVTGEQITILEMIAARLDRAVERAAGVDQLRRLRESALRAVGRVLELRDDETYGHTDRVTQLAVRLGEALQLDRVQLQHLRWGAYLHDIGKVAVRDDLLRKPGALTADERLQMQAHVVTGDELLRDESFVPATVRLVVRHHHERWDGTGYPDRLAGPAIPLLARIFSVVDVYDALTSVRPYKRAWSHDEALAELQRCAGTQFDPWVVRAFAELTL